MPGDKARGRLLAEQSTHACSDFFTPDGTTIETCEYRPGNCSVLEMVIEQYQTGIANLRVPPYLRLDNDSVLPAF